MASTTLSALVAALDDDPWCGTRPHWPPRPHRLLGDDLLLSLDAVALNPQPLPPRSLAATAAMQQVRLYQVGRSLQALDGPAADAGGALMSFASSEFDDICGSVPISVLIQWLLNHPHGPGPGPKWLQDIEQLGVQLAVAARMEGGTGAAMQQAGVSLLKEQMKGLQQTRQAAGAG